MNTTPASFAENEIGALDLLFLTLASVPGPIFDHADEDRSLSGGVDRVIK